MSNQKEIRARIASTISTQQITKAMKLVSATKLKKASDAIIRMRPYARKLQGIMGNLQDSVDDPSLSVYFQNRDVKKVLFVVISSDRGLCGGFNANVIKRTRTLLEDKYPEQNKAGNVTLLCIGKKAAEYFRKTGVKIDERFIGLFQHLNAETAFEAGDYVLDAYRRGEYDQVELIYNEFKNAATQILSNEVILPITSVATGTHQHNDYIFEPGKIAILQDLVPRSIKTQIYRGMLDSLASEHGARMISMDKATENAGDMLRSLRLAYNQARQAAITREISEIVGGAAALEG
ncbi:MAG: ATP synthase F1 subunit gamma [Bacteroidetes bacterium]|nr:ATP synthase F1 subunit gamma [Bacteroidota bacterium]